MGWGSTETGGQWQSEGLEHGATEQLADRDPRASPRPNQCQRDEIPCPPNEELVQINSMEASIPSPITGADV